MNSNRVAYAYIQLLYFTKIVERCTRYCNPPHVYRPQERYGRKLASSTHLSNYFLNPGYFLTWFKLVGYGPARSSGSGAHFHSYGQGVNLDHNSIHFEIKLIAAATVVTVNSFDVIQGTRPSQGLLPDGYVPVSERFQTFTLRMISQLIGVGELKGK